MLDGRKRENENTKKREEEEEKNKNEIKQLQEKARTCLPVRHGIRLTREVEAASPYFKGALPVLRKREILSVPGYRGYGIYLVSTCDSLVPRTHTRN